MTEKRSIEQLADRPASVLSGGELQRTLMARTLVADTPLWVLDEPTNHLDPETVEWYATEASSMAEEDDPDGTL
jgi:ABC-type cobalamin/Fe3+-siderophores transport system ATPase subunit